MTASTWFKARASTGFMTHAPANEHNGPPRSLRPAGPALLASAHPALALGEWIRCRTRGIYSFSCLRITSLLRLNHLALLLHPVEDTANSWDADLWNKNSSVLYSGFQPSMCSTQHDNIKPIIVKHLPIKQFYFLRCHPILMLTVDSCFIRA